MSVLFSNTRTHSKFSILHSASLRAVLKLSRSLYSKQVRVFKNKTRTNSRGIARVISCILSFSNHRPCFESYRLSLHRVMLSFCTRVEGRFLLHATKDLLLSKSMMYFPPNRNGDFCEYVSPRFQGRQRGPWEQTMNLARGSS